MTVSALVRNLPVLIRLCFVALISCVSRQALAAGNTSYDSPPLGSEIYQVSWGASADQTPAELFWEKGSFFTNPENLAKARAAAQSIDASGKVPFSGSQRWQDTYVRALPRSDFESPPSWVNESYVAKPEFSAWAMWIRERPQYLDVAYDGGSFPLAFRSWGGSHGHIDPLMPLDADDIPTEMTGSTYGDWFAYKWGQLARKTGAYGISLSDFSDSLPHGTTAVHDFNPRIIAAFEARTGKLIPGSSTAEKANYIIEHEFNKWTDFWSEGYGHFFAALARELKSNAGHDALIIDQNGFVASLMRMRGVDHRIVLHQISTTNIIFTVDTLTMSTERSGVPMVNSTGMMGELAAYEPNARFGANLHADEPRFWEGVKKHWSTLSAAEQKERGLKELKRLWLETGWMHIADRDGKVRRGISYLERSYWDAGLIDPAVLSTIRSIIPTRPFGSAFYYSGSIAKKREVEMAKLRLPESECYLSQEKHSFVDLRNSDDIATDYFVSDAAIDHLAPKAWPAAWIVLERFDPKTGKDLLPPNERKQLARIAPILSTQDEIRKFPMPLSYSPNVTGIGFYDQNGRLIITLSNLLDEDQTATVFLHTLPNGQYTATEILNDNIFPIAVANHEVNFSVELSRWDTRVLAIDFLGGSQKAK